MKKSLLALALMGAFSSAAMAQSSVTIYGIADIGLQNLKNGSPAGATTKLSSGQVQGSRLGFKGVEDLGDGLKAHFDLVMGFNLDEGSSGQGGRTFGRRSVVGLTGDFGVIELGRDKTINNLFIDAFDPFYSGFINSGNGLSNLYFFGGTANVAGAASTANSAGRVGNAIFYYTPNWGGFRGSATYGFGEAAGSNTPGSSYGITLRYTNFGLDIAYSYSKDNNQLGTVAPVNGINFSNTINARSANTFAVSYDIDTPAGKLTPVFIYEKQKDENRLAPRLDQQNYSIGGTLKFDGSNSLLATWTKIVDDTRRTPTAALPATTVGDARQWALGFQHNLSKRTDLYIAYAKTNQDATSRKVAAVVAGADVTEFTLGIRHKF